MEIIEMKKEKKIIGFFTRADQNKLEIVKHISLSRSPTSTLDIQKTFDEMLDLFIEKYEKAPTPKKTQGDFVSVRTNVKDNYNKILSLMKKYESYPNLDDDHVGVILEQVFHSRQSRVEYKKHLFNYVKSTNPAAGTFNFASFEEYVEWLNNQQR